MKRLAVGCGLLAIALVRPAYAEIAVPGCCACLIHDHDQALPALFCASPNSEAELIAAEDRCEGIPAAQLLCLEQTHASTEVTAQCVEQLRGEGINCPAGPRAPALGNTALAGLAGLLAMLGASNLRRRATRRG
jgi:hypothetical protein